MRQGNILHAQKKLATGQRYWTSTRRILRSSSVVSVRTYVRLVQGLTGVSYDGTIGDRIDPVTD